MLINLFIGLLLSHANHQELFVNRATLFGAIWLDCRGAMNWLTMLLLDFLKKLVCKVLRIVEPLATLATTDAKLKSWLIAENSGIICNDTERRVVVAMLGLLFLNWVVIDKSFLYRNHTLFNLLDSGGFHGGNWWVFGACGAKSSSFSFRCESRT